MDGDSLTGRVWVLAGPDRRLIEDIDTDQIYHNAHLHITDPAQMGRFALGNLEGWKDFPDRVRGGDVLIAGRNFGAGSSRQQAVDCFAALGVAAVIAPSFGAIYFRNAVNSGFLVLRSDTVADCVLGGGIVSGDELRLDLRSGDGRNITRDGAFSIMPLSRVQQEVYAAGGLFAYARRLDGRQE